MHNMLYAKYSLAYVDKLHSYGILELVAWYMATIDFPLSSKCYGHNALV